MSDGIDLSAAPAKRRRNLARVLTVAGVSAGAWFAISLASTANAQSPIDDISAALQDVSSSTAQAVSTVSDAARPVVDTAARTADPVVQAAVPVVAGAADLAAPVVEQAADVAEPVLDAVTEVTAPIVEQVSEVAAPVVDQVDDLTVPVVEAVAPIVDEVSTVTAPVVTLSEPVLEAVSPVLDPVAGVVAPVVEAIDPAAPIIDPLLGAPSPALAVDQALPLVSSVDSAALVDEVPTGIGPTTSGDRSGGGAPATGAEYAGNALLPNTFTGTGAQYSDVANDSTPAVTAVLRPSTAPVDPTTPATPGVPAPDGAPGCPAVSGSVSTASGSPQVAATVPAGQHIVLTRAPATDGDHAAALLTRCDEPGTSPG